MHTKFLDPMLWAQDVGRLLEVVTVLVVLAFELDASLVVDIVDEAVLGLVGVWESWVEFGSP